MPYLTVDEVEVYYRDEGNGPAIILGHGSTGRGAQWRDLIARLSDRFRLIAPDHLGYGKTGPHTGDLSVMKHERAIITALMDLAGEPVHLVGHSYGGAVLTQVATQAPERVRTLTVVEPVCVNLLAPAGKITEYQEFQAFAGRVIGYVDAGNPRGAARAFVDYWGGSGAYDALDPRVKDAVIRGTSKLRQELPCAFEDGPATCVAIAKLSMPILLIAGANTTLAARGVVDVLRRLWPQARYAEIAQAGHMAPVTHADLVNPIIEAFITQASEQP